MVLVLLFIIGLCFGSFLGVVVDRLPQHKSIIIGRSQCDSCHHSLSWYDLVPVFSYVLLEGKCRYCHKKFSLEYPVFEISTGFLLLVFYFLLGQPIAIMSIVSFSFEVGIFFSLLVLAMIDSKEGILPDKIILFALLPTILFLFMNHIPFIPHILSGLGVALFFLLIILITHGRGMGMGDVKLSFLLGFFLGFPNIFIAVYMAFLTGAAIAIILVMARKKKFHGGSIAFGPFLILGTFLAAFWGDKLWQIVLRILGI